MFSTVFLLAGSAALSGACGVPDTIAHLAPRQAPPTQVINNVHVFDGVKFTAEKSIVICGDIISNANPAGATIIDGKGGYLIPGLIDAHCHISNCSYLDTMRDYGITTALDMGTYPYSSIEACKGVAGRTDIRGSSIPATVNGSALSHFPHLPPDALVPTPAAGVQFVKDRIAEGADYIKIFLDPGVGPDDATITAIVEAAHQAGKLVISHATTFDAYSQAQAAKVDIPTHSTVDAVLNASALANLTSYGAHVVPTLIMMQSIINVTGLPFQLYTQHAEQSVTLMHEAGIPIIVGTDSNKVVWAPAHPPFGESIHDEMELLVAAGLSPLAVLRGATSKAANTFRLHDRGAIKTGMRADLVLLSANPLKDISNTRMVERVWVAGNMTEIFEE